VLKITASDKNLPWLGLPPIIFIYSSTNRAAAKASLLMAQEAI